MVNGVSAVAGLANSGGVRSDAQTLAPEIESARLDRAANLNDRLDRGMRTPSLTWRSENRGSHGYTESVVTQLGQSEGLSVYHYFSFKNNGLRGGVTRITPLHRFGFVVTPCPLVGRAFSG